VLLVAMEKGFLFDRSNYGSLAEITGLTRKQISNWARRKIKRGGCEHNLQNYAPVRTISKELLSIMEEKLTNVTTQQLKKELQTTTFVEPSKPGYSPENSVSSDFNVLMNEKIRVTGMFPLESSYSGAQFSSESFLPPELNVGAAQKLPRKSRRSYCSQRPHNSSFVFKSMPENATGSARPWSVPPTFVNKYWVIEQAFNGINEVDHQEVEILSVLTSTNYNVIISHLLNSGWKLNPPKTFGGVRYVRK